MRYLKKIVIEAIMEKCIVLAGNVETFGRFN